MTRLDLPYRKIALALVLRIDYRRANHVIAVAVIQVRNYPHLNLGEWQ